MIRANLKNLNNYKIYLKVEEAVHDFFRKHGYLKLDLPVLSPALIPESYLEIFKTEFNYFNKKVNLFLTPSPELFMKRLLTAGIGNCYYLGKSFRNGEPNSDYHSPEFTMLEYYKVGASYLDLADEILEMMKFINSRIKTSSFAKASEDKQKSKISFESWEKYTVTQAFEAFSDISENELFDEKLFKKRAEEKGYEVKNFTYQDLFSQIISQEIEPKLGINGRPTLLYDYPKEISSLAKLKPGGKIAKRVEFYIDGVEIGGCCEELNDWKEQKKRFIEHIKKRKSSGLINHKVDDEFIEMLKYGLPNCTGAGIGFNRLAMVFSGVKNINELKLIAIDL